MKSISRKEIYYGRYYSPSEIIKEINSISLRQVKELAENLLSGSEVALTALGPVSENDFNGIMG
ncbi:hypothetical protein [Candidatus Hakubella thermalkaliphila]|uniref:Peptidase M16 N-terminal domain-containing protein n=1 Tax=Candidatus Hakubella thermalkaliphila TaxID=2754717 RepID=A0A6V8PBC1_9ACTN|nr:hypothetical protein [Candidatus Hakubella thermalkaliphila]GFP28924.1 hypothetical protein HKBW3S33_02340 [Candidatus Hakubella thermalkaliphila]